jgi:hypothetical protein
MMIIFNHLVASLGLHMGPPFALKMLISNQVTIATLYVWICENLTYHLVLINCYKTSLFSEFIFFYNAFSQFGNNSIHCGKLFSEFI